MSFVTTKTVIRRVMAFEYSIYTCFVCLCVGRKEIHERMWNRDSNEKSGLHSRRAAEKDDTRLGAAEVPADRYTAFFFSSSLLSHGENTQTLFFIVPHVKYMYFFPSNLYKQIHQQDILIYILYSFYFETVCKTLLHIQINRWPVRLAKSHFPFPFLGQAFKNKHNL